MYLTGRHKLVNIVQGLGPTELLPYFDVTFIIKVMDETTFKNPARFYSRIIKITLQEEQLLRSTNLTR